MKNYRLDPKNPPQLTPEEARRLDRLEPLPGRGAQRRHPWRRVADQNRIEGIATSAAPQAVLDAYIRGEIEAGDLVTAYRRARGEAMTDADPIIANPELLTAIAIRAFARAKAEALAENDRLGIPSYGSEGGKIVVRHPPQRRVP
jgi:hypothetical protein